MLDPFNPVGSTQDVRFNTSRSERWDTCGPPPKNQVNWVIYDSDWEAEFCRLAEAHPKVLAYTKNHNLGLEVPYRMGAETRRYFPDFIVIVDDGYGSDDPLHLVVEIKGYRREDAKVKKETMETYWIPGVNNLQSHGRWAFAEFTDVYAMESDFKRLIERH
jgi:type III restriction enzyme